MKLFKIFSVIVTALAAFMAPIVVDTAPITNPMTPVSATWVNNLKCGKPICEPEIANLSAPVFSTQYSKPIGKFSSDLIARLIISKDNAHIHLPSDLSLLSRVYNFKEKPVFGIVAKDVHNTIWIAFRGTDNLIELGEDAMYWQAQFVGKDNDNQTAGQIDMYRTRVHAGFLMVYNKFKKDIYNFVSDDNVKNIIITGYSLGGAVATIAGVDLTLKFNKSIAVYTFASPMVGDKDFADLGDRTVPIYRYINTCDIVHTLPNSVSPNFINPNKPFMYQHCGQPITFTDNWLSLSMNHYISVYVKNS